MICFIEVLGTKSLSAKAVKMTININAIIQISPYGDDSKAMVFMKEEAGAKFMHPIYTEHPYEDFQRTLVAFRSVEVKVLA